MKKCAAILLSLSMLLLILGVIAFDDIQRKSLFTAVGTVFGLAGLD